VSEPTSGVVRRGRLTRAGHRRLRTALTQAAPHSKKAVHIGPALRARRANQPPDLVALADRAMRRQHDSYWRLIKRGKHRNVAVTACAHELTGFIWALLHGQVVSVTAAETSPSHHAREPGKADDFGTIRSSPRRGPMWQAAPAAEPPNVDRGSSRRKTVLCALRWGSPA